MADIVWEGKNVVFVLTPSIDSSVLINSETHIFECIYLNNSRGLVTPYFFNNSWHLSICLSQRSSLPSKAKLPEIVFAPAMHPPIAIQGQHMRPTSGDTNQERRVEAFDFTQLREGVLVWLGQLPSKAKGEATPREQPAIGGQ